MQNDEKRIAVFIDFENVAMGVRESKYGNFNIDLVLKRLVEKGKIMVKRAYSDWHRYADFKRAFHQAAIELIDVPQTRYSGKNSADKRDRIVSIFGEMKCLAGMHSYLLSTDLFHELQSCDHISKRTATSPHEPSGFGRSLISSMITTGSPERHCGAG